MKHGDIKGRIDVGLGLDIRVYLAVFSGIYDVSLCFNYELGVVVKGKVEDKEKVPLTPNGLTLFSVFGVKVAVDPAIVLAGKVELTMKTKIEGQIGGGATSHTGGYNLTKYPTVKSDKEDGTIEIKGKLFWGVDLNPSISFINKKIATIQLEAPVGLEFSAKMYVPSENYQPDEKHLCKSCLDGNIDVKFELKFEGKLFNNDKLKIELKLLETTIHLFDFYLSFDYGEFGLSSCPHNSLVCQATCIDATVLVDGKPRLFPALIFIIPFHMFPMVWK